MGAASSAITTQAMLDELKSILQESATLPRENQLPNKEMVNALRNFKNEFDASYSRETTLGDINAFMEKYDMFGSLKKSLASIGAMGRRVVIIEGADGTGKTTLADTMAREIGGIAMENQASKVFERMFGMPRIYKTVVADYNTNVLVELLFYMVVNTIALGMAADYFKGGAKYVIMDSSILRTLASKLSRPAMEGEGASGVVVDKGVQELIRGSLNPQAIKMLTGSRKSLLMVMLYASERAIATQVHSRGASDDYDTNKEYAKMINDFLLEDQLALKKAGVPTLSIYLADPASAGRENSNSYLKMADAVVVQKDLATDTRKKAGIVEDFLKGLG